MTHGSKAILWIEDYCLVPFGFDKGQRVRLTPEQKEILHRVFDTDASPEIAAPLSSYLALFYILRAARPGGARFRNPAQCRQLHNVERGRPRSARRGEARRRTHCLPRVGDEISARGRFIAQISRTEKFDLGFLGPSQRGLHQRRARRRRIAEPSLRFRSRVARFPPVVLLQSGPQNVPVHAAAIGFVHARFSRFHGAEIRPARISRNRRRLPLALLERRRCGIMRSCLV
jgi:hypothetical protein